jgi:PAS domain S-box-containing protein
VIRDISERKRAELALRESEERFRRLSEATQEGIAIHEGSLILDANQQGAAMLGYDLQEIIGMDAFRFIAPESHDLVRQHIASGYEGTYEVLALRKDGATLPVEFCGRPALYQGRPIRIGVMRDISERKRAEEALQRARDELETRVERRMGRAARYKLTFRELAVLYLVAEGMADKEIAFRLGISPRTASKHVENILGKMRATSRTEAGVRAIQEELVESLK